MKITKIGVKPTDRIWFGKCRQCGSEAEAQEGELAIMHHRDGPFLWHRCPACGAGGYSGFGGMLFHPRKETP